MSSGPASEPLSTLTTSPGARRGLARDGLIVEDLARTRGGHSVGVLHLAATEGRAIAFVRPHGVSGFGDPLSSWAIGNRSDLARIGPAGELMAHASLVTAAPTGWLPLDPETRTASATSSVHPSRLVR